MRKYYKNSKPSKSNPPRGRPPRPDLWITGPDEFEHERYYAWLRHRAQARHRGEPYYLTHADWCTIWPRELFERRGNYADDLCCCKIHKDEGWHLTNVHVVTNRWHRANSPGQRKSK